MSFKKRFNEILKYPHKRSSLNYFLLNPSLLFVISQKTSKFYFLETLENILDLNFISCLHSFLPGRFLDYLKEKEFDADHGQGVPLILYSIVRAYKPAIIVETGVARGISSAFILCAMNENRKGHLYSIDLPPYMAYDKIDKEKFHVLKDGQRHKITENLVGDFVPEYLKDRWTLILGDAKTKLPELLKKINKIDIFFHDSLHTYEHMLFEYETAWPHITKNGLLISHDVLWNEAFLEFSKKVNLKPSIYYSLGVIKK